MSFVEGIQSLYYTRSWISILKDPNIVRKSCKIIKFKIRCSMKLEKIIKELHNELEKIHWTEDTLDKRLRLYKELGNLYHTYRINRVYIETIHKRKINSANITG